MTNPSEAINQNQKQQPNKDQVSNQNSAANNKVGNNTQKDEPLSQKKTGGMKDERESCSSSDAGRKASNA